MQIKYVIIRIENAWAETFCVASMLFEWNNNNSHHTHMH